MTAPDRRGAGTPFALHRAGTAFPSSPDVTMTTDHTTDACCCDDPKCCCSCGCDSGPCCGKCCCD